VIVVAVMAVVMVIVVTMIMMLMVVMTLLAALVPMFVPALVPMFVPTFLAMLLPTLVLLMPLRLPVTNVPRLVFPRPYEVHLPVARMILVAMQAPGPGVLGRNV
jgi:hypothetical protein